MFMIFGTLTYLAIDGHLMLLGALADSFHTLPIGSEHVDKNFLLSVALWGARVFDTGLLIALPAVIALVIVNLALGVVTRAAPQLNLFGIGFTITLLSGFFVLLTGLDGIMSGITSLINSTLAAVSELISAPGVGVP
jgi:flagellar biosynthesis protein FliR